MNDSLMRVYFDYNATSPLTAEVVDAVTRVSRDQYGNASSVHHFGQQAKALIDEARSAVAALIKGDPSEVVFTSGGTESDNFAIRGAADALESTGRRHLIASAIEHEAVLNTLNREIAQAAASPDVVKKLAAGLGVAPPYSSVAEKRKAFLAEYARWSEVVKKANIKLEE